MIRFLRAYYPALAIAAVMLWSAWSVLSYRVAQAPPGTITIHLSHYQLEAGVRDAFTLLMKDYERLHPGVRIVMDSIPEAGYGQWVTTQLIGGTAPDIIELNGGVMTPPILAVYATRYFTNLSEVVNQPNPYNAGTSLEKIPLRNTYKDGMKTAFIEEAQRFVAVPMSAQGTKLFYNKPLLKKLTGLDTPPTEYRAFLEVCRKIRAQSDDAGNPYVPISCSKWHVNQWIGIVFQALTYRNLFKADFNGDLALGTDEFYAAYRSHRLSMHDETDRLYYQMMREVAEYFPSGWAGLQRDEAVFRFAQQRAVFMSATTQEAYSLYDLAQGKFAVDISDFPQPSATDPVYGKYVDGPHYEKPDDTFRFVVTRYSPHPDIALDFLLFLASQKQNERLNELAHWVPCIIGTRTPDFLHKFEPHLEGIMSGFQVAVGVDSATRWNQLTALYQNNQVSYDEIAAEFEHHLDEEGGREYENGRREARRDQSRDETVAATLRVEAMKTADPNAPAWSRYAAFLRTRLMDPEYNRNQLDQMVSEPPPEHPLGPYEYSPEVLDRVRARLQRATAAPASPP